MKSRQASFSRGRYAATQRLAAEILEVLEEYAPRTMSTRQIYYQCVSHGAVQNCQAGYDRVQRLVVELRRSGDIEYDRVVDRTRAKHQRAGWESAEDIITACGAQFRRDQWSTQRTVVMIGLEKAALEGVFAEVVDEYGASLWTLQGYGSESFLYEWATEINAHNKEGQRVEIVYFGDHDPTGFDIERAARLALEGHGADFGWRRAGLVNSDFAKYELVNVPVKASDTRAKRYLRIFGDRAAELDALPPDELHRRLVEAFDEYVDHAERERLLRNEELERESLRLVAANWGRAVAAGGGAR